MAEPIDDLTLDPATQAAVDEMNKSMPQLDEINKKLADLTAENKKLAETNAKLYAYVQRFAEQAPAAEQKQEPKEPAKTPANVQELYFQDFLNSLTQGR